MSTDPTTNLGAITGGSDPSQDAPPAAPNPQADPATLQQVATGGVAQPVLAPAQSGSRLGAIISAVANVASTALSGIPDKGRPSFVSGLGEGARAEQAAQATQNQIKFKTFDDQVRIAQLHNQDLKLQNDTQEQTDAHKKADLDNRQLANSMGIDYDTIPSDGDTVMDHLTAQTAMNGSASVPPGTHLSGDGKTVNIPQDTQATRDGQKQMYSMLGPAFALPSLPPGAQFVPPDSMNRLTNKLHGYGSDGSPIKHDDLPGAIGALQAQRDQLAKNGATAQALQAVDNTLGIYKANLTALDEHKESVLDDASQRDTAEKIALQNNKAQNQKDVNAAKPQKADTNMFVGTDASGNQVAGTAGDLQTAGASGVTKLDADTGKKVITARQLISPDGLFSQIKQDMLNLDANGKMGSSATARFNDAMLQKAGSDADYAPLFVHTHLLSTALMQAHVGSRGSSDMMEEFQKLANAGKMNAATLRSSLGAEFNYVKEKAMLPKKQQAGGQ